MSEFETTVHLDQPWSGVSAIQTERHFATWREHPSGSLKLQYRSLY